MGATPRYGLAYPDRGSPIRESRSQLEANANTTEDALTATQAYVNQLVTLLPTSMSQTFIGLDEDGAPYFDPSGAIVTPVGIGLDTDATPYFVVWNQEGT